MLDLIDRKHHAACAQALIQAHARLAEVQAHVRGGAAATAATAATIITTSTASAGLTASSHICSSSSFLTEQLRDAEVLSQSGIGRRMQQTVTEVVFQLIKPALDTANSAIGCAGLFHAVCATASDAPKQRLYQAVLSRIQRAVQKAEGEEGAAAYVTSITSQQLACQTPADAHSSRAHGASSESEPGCSSAAVSLVLARDAASTMKSDLSQLATAQVKNGGKSCLVFQSLFK